MPGRHVHAVLLLLLVAVINTAVDRVLRSAHQRRRRRHRSWCRVAVQWHAGTRPRGVAHRAHRHRHVGGPQRLLCQRQVACPYRECWRAGHGLTRRSSCASRGSSSSSSGSSALRTGATRRGCKGCTGGRGGGRHPGQIRFGRDGSGWRRPRRIRELARKRVVLKRQRIKNVHGHAVWRCWWWRCWCAIRTMEIARSCCYRGCTDSLGNGMAAEECAQRVAKADKAIHRDGVRSVLRRFLGGLRQLAAVAAAPRFVLPHLLKRRHQFRRQGGGVQGPTAVAAVGGRVGCAVVRMQTCRCGLDANTLPIHDG